MERAQHSPARQKAFLACLAGTECALDTARGQVFNGVKACLQRLGIVADLVLLTNQNARSCYSEWNFHSLPPCTVMCLKRRELAHCLALQMAQGYDRCKVLVIGFGKEALAAAEKNQALFFPIQPGQEAQCWHMLEEEALPKLLHGTYRGEYQQRLLQRHSAAMRAMEENTEP